MSHHRGIPMKKQLIPLFTITILLASSLSSIAYPTRTQSQNNSPEPTGNTIYIDDSNTQGPWNGTKDYPYQHIYDGILHATDGDTVYVFNGIYNETVLVNKSIYFRGQQQEETIIDGNNTGTVVQITSNDVHIRRFTIRNSGGFPENAGITVHANRTTITECTIYRARSGISISNRSGTALSFCRFYTNGYGVTCTTSDYTTIDSCTFYHNGIGVYLSDTHVTTVTNSYADTNGIGFYATHSSNIEISTSAARDNNDNEGGMFFSHSRFITITNCHLNHNGVGVNLINSSSCFIQACNFTLNTHYACKLNDALSSITLTNCIFTKNLRYGLYAEHSAFSITWSNLFDDENYGLYTKSTAVNAQYNWWGSPTGPAHTGLTRADRGIFNPREIIYRPWLTFPMPDIGPTWILNKIFTKPQYTNPWPEHITFSESDTDGDGAPDSWEQKWGYDPLVWEDHYHLDPDNDSLNNIEECYMDQYNSSPFHKDVFFELDWTTAMKPNVTNEPPTAQINQMIHAFAVHNITLHVDAGALGGGEEIPGQSFVTYADLIDLYWKYFLHGDMNNPRQRIFHYGLICDYTEGPGFVFVGWDNLNSFAYGLQFLADNYPAFSRERLSVTSIMHEAGHTFNLIATRYTGIDNALTTKPYYKEFWFYCTYFSTLNYLYAASILNYSDGTHGLGDFDDWGHLEFSFFKNTHLEYPAG
jgi:parallel beta-helix repeat protein